MPRHAHLGLSIALFFCLPISNAEAGMNKCTDGRQITYTNEPCEKTGLTSAGPIKDAVTVMPLIPKNQTDPSEESGKENGANNIPRNKAPRNDDSGADVSRDATTKPISPLVDKMPER
ncbi:MAG: hypothetical protein HY935_07075 [Nitrosomonadales bacterium]|nr:hypothetical protein [Nitrosomonadales bacterium]